ncbi:MAG: manganese efflux pump [Lachnospiraceae bacterium]|nr:manganese efflux pump [Lachnospiraceae bacterium]
MGLGEVLLLSVGLAMDAFAVSVCKGLSLKKVTIKEASVCGIWFGLFQGIMPLLGYLLGSGFASFIDRFAAWIAFLILTILGINMLREAFGSDEDDEEATPDLGFKVMLGAAVATSIDAMAVGVTFVAVPVRIFSGSALINTFLAVACIGIITYVISALGVFIGGYFGAAYKSGAVAAGGSILIFIGLKALMDKYDITGAGNDNIFWLLLPFAGTVLGALLVFFRINTPDKLKKCLIALSAGIMLSASIWCLMTPSFSLPFFGSVKPFIVVFIGFWVGMLFQFGLDNLVPHTHGFSGETEGLRSEADKPVKMMMAMIIHHIPEGIAIGAVYAGFLYGEGIISRYSMIAVTVGMLIQNFPEAAFLSVPVKEEGRSKGASFFYGMMSGGVEPIIGIVTVIIAGLFPPILPYVMSLSAGAMIYTIVESMIPEMIEGEVSDRVVLAFAAGFSLMMLLAYGLPML